MDTTMSVRIMAGVLAVAVLAFVIYRRKHAKANRVIDLQYRSEMDLIR